MKLSALLIKVIIWSLVFSVLIRVIYGLHAAFGFSALIIPLILGILAAISFTPPTTGKFLITSVLHIVFIALFTVIINNFGIMDSVANDSTAFFSKLTEADISRINIFKSILVTISVYFAAYIISSCVCYRIRRTLYYRNQSVDLETEDGESV